MDEITGPQFLDLFKQAFETVPGDVTRDPGSQNPPDYAPPALRNRTGLFGKILDYGLGQKPGDPNEKSMPFPSQSATMRLRRQGSGETATNGQPPPPYNAGRAETATNADMVPHAIKAGSLDPLTLYLAQTLSKIAMAQKSAMSPERVPESQPPPPPPAPTPRAVRGHIANGAMPASGLYPQSPKLASLIAKLSAMIPTAVPPMPKPQPTPTPQVAGGGIGAPQMRPSPSPSGNPMPSRPGGM